MYFFNLFLACFVNNIVLLFLAGCIGKEGAVGGWKGRTGMGRKDGNGRGRKNGTGMGRMDENGRRGKSGTGMGRMNGNRRR